MPTKHFLGTLSGDLRVAANNSELAVPAATDIIDANVSAIGFVRLPDTYTAGSSYGGFTWEDNNQADDLSILDTLRINGDVALTGFVSALLHLKSINGTLSANAAGEIVLTRLLGTDTLTLGNLSGNQLEIQQMDAGAKIVFATSLSSPITIDSFNGGGQTFHANSGTANDLQGINLTSDAVIEGTGTLSNFSIVSGNTYATQLSGTKAVGTTITGTYSLGNGFSPNFIADDGDHNLASYDDAEMVVGGGHYSFKVVQDAIDGGFNYGAMVVHDEDDAIDLGIGGFTIGASGLSDAQLQQQQQYFLMKRNHHAIS